MNYLRKSTGVSITIGPFIHQISATTGTYLDNVLLGGTSPGLVKANSSVSVSLGSRNFAGVSGCSGYFQLGLTSADTGVTGLLKIFISGASAGSNSFGEVVENYEVVTQNYYDFVHGDDFLSVSAVTFGVTAVSDSGVTVVYSDSGVTVNRINSGVTLATGVTTQWFSDSRVSDSGVTVQSLTTTAEADVNAEVVDALNVDTYAEPAQGTPAATTTLEEKISYIYKFLRNKVTNDGTAIKVFADNTTTCDHKALVSESGGTVTRGEYTTGA